MPTAARSPDSRRPASMRACDPVATCSVTVMRSVPRSRMPRLPVRQPAGARLDQGATLERELDGLTHPKIGEYRPLRAEAKHLDRVRGFVKSLERGPVAEAVERAVEGALDRGRGGDIDLAAPQRLDDRAAIRVEANLDPAKRRRAPDVARERAQRHAEPGDPRGDREGPRVHRLPLVLRAPLRGRACEDVRGQHARDEWVQIPTFAREIGEADGPAIDTVDTLDAVGHPAARAIGRSGPIVVEGEAHVVRGDRFAVLPPRVVTQLERRDQAS